MITRTCKCGCGASISHKHQNAKFLNQKHKDRYWNEVNPRGKFVHLGMEDDYRDYGDLEDHRHIFDLED